MRFERPDKQWSVMLVNRDQFNDHAVKIVFAGAETKRDRHFTGPIDRITFGSNEYQWHQEGTGGHADPDGAAIQIDHHGRRGDALSASQGVHHSPAWPGYRCGGQIAYS